MNFLKQAIHDLVDEDGLVVLPRECGCIELLACFIKNYIKLCHKSGHIVFVLNADNLKDVIIAELKSKRVDESLLPQEINSKTGSVKDRQLMYNKGGVFFISSLILQLDFLQNHLPYQKLAGLLVYDVHKLHTDSVYLFCILLFRHHCQGFVKCFSDNAVECCKAFPQVSSFLNELTVSGLFLYPRYRDIVASSFDKFPIAIENRRPQYSKWMETSMDAVFSMIKHIINEIKLLPCDLNEVLSLDYCMQPLLANIIRKDIREHGDAYSMKTKDLLQDLIHLNGFVRCLNSSSVIELYFRLQNAYREVRTDHGNSCYWMECKEAESFVMCINQEIFGILDGKLERKDWLQPPVKWQELVHILNELNELNDGEKVLIMVMEKSSLIDVHNYLLNPTIFMLVTLQKKLNQIMTTQTSKQSKESRLLQYVKKELSKFSQDEISLYYEQSIGYQQVNDGFSSECSVLPVSSSFFPHLTIYLSVCYTASSLSNPYYHISPTSVIMVDATYPSIRQAEVFNAKTSEHFKHFYVLLYEPYEMDQYIRELQTENQAFKKLIKNRDHFIQINKWKESIPSTETVSTRNPNMPTQNLIIVDSREFKSSLPPALYKANIILLPFTLEICDYVLSPMIGVERKAYLDLVASLKHGRLQKQMERMCRMYRYPVLLIESFSNEVVNGLSSIVGRLSVLIRCYPQMRILWSFSELSSVHMFQKIKKGKSQPSLEEVMCLKDEPILNGNKQEMGMIDTLVTFPGIDLDSAYAILRRIRKVSDICVWNKQQMEEVMTPSNAALLYSFLHTPFYYVCFFKSTIHW